MGVCCALPALLFSSQYSPRGVPVKLFALSLKKNGSGTTLTAEHLHFMSRHPLHVKEAEDVGRRKASAGLVCGQVVLLCLGGTAVPTTEQDPEPGSAAAGCRGWTCLIQYY